MAGSVNKVILVGNLGRDPEVKFSQDGVKIVNFTMATSDTWKDKNTGERREKTEWHRIVVFNEHLAGIIERYVRKGSKIYIEGALQTRKWTGNDGVEKYSTEVILNRYRGEMIMLDAKGSGGDPGPLAPPDSAPTGGGSSDSSPGDSSPGGSGPSGSGPSGGPGADLDDEIPF